MSKTRVALGAAALVVGAAGGAVVERALNAPSPDPARAVDPASLTEAVAFEDCPPQPRRPPYPVNKYGMTYGSGAGIDEDDPGPDLVAAYGTNGRCGFIRASDRDAPVWTLASAVRTPDPATDQRTVPLYARDGVTVIGDFEIGPDAP